MATPQPINQLLSSEMDRRKFLGVLGAGALVITGVTGIVAGLSRISHRDANSGYGASSYGGKSTDSSSTK